MAPFLCTGSCFLSGHYQQEGYSLLTLVKVKPYLSGKQNGPRARSHHFLAGPLYLRSRGETYYWPLLFCHHLEIPWHRCLAHGRLIIFHLVLIILDLDEKLIYRPSLCPRPIGYLFRLSHKMVRELNHYIVDQGEHSLELLHYTNLPYSFLEISSRCLDSV